MESGNPFFEFESRYGPAQGELGPYLFVLEIVGVVPDDWQEQVLREYGRGGRRISIRSCHGPGKTALVAWMILFNLFCRFPQKTVATAPTVSQLETALVAEVHKWLNRLDPRLKQAVIVNKNKLSFAPRPMESFFEAKTARAENPEALQGVHEDDGWVLLIADEASGVPEAIFEAASSSMSGVRACTVLMSNPVRTSGLFYDTHHSLKDMWFTMHVSYKDSSRVSPDFVEDIRRRYGERSNAYRVRVLGEFPLGDLDTIIPFEWVEMARQRDLVFPPRMSELWGLDIARFGDDESVLLRRTKKTVLPVIEVWEGYDTMYTTGRVVHAYKHAEPQPDEILGDVIGLGAGVIDRGMELNIPIRGVNVSETPSMRDDYVNLRAELWFKAKAWFEARDVVLPKKCACDICVKTGNNKKTDHVEKLIEQLTSVRYKYTSNGKILVEPKPEYKKRKKESPNIADAFVLTFAGEVATMIHGSGGNIGWTSNVNEPIRRPVRVV